VQKNSRIYIAGHQGMVGSVLYNKLKSQGYENIITIPFETLDLRNKCETEEFILQNKPEYIFLIAGKVGGIQANIDLPGEFLYDNLMISANVIEASRIAGVKKLLFLGSSCIYPRLSDQPIKEKYLLSGELEPTNEGYAIGKIAGLKLCEYYGKQYKCNFISAIPPNLYGPKDSFSLQHSHVISALIKKIHHAKIIKTPSVEMWGSGKVRREFLFSEDLVEGLIFLMNNYDRDSHINIGASKDISIMDLANLIKEIIDYRGDFSWNKSKPDGMPRKLMDSSKINALGWVAKTSLRKGLEKTYKWYLENII
jgi:GDP-L-fucose synthase